MVGSVSNFPSPWSAIGFGAPSDAAMPAEDDPWASMPGLGGRPLVLSDAYTPARAASHTPPSYEVGKTPQHVIDELKASPDGAQRRLGRTIENAQAAYGDLIAKGAHVVVTTSIGNSGQPVMVIRGPGFDASKDARVHTHYHGDNATVADPLGSKAGTNARIRDVIAKDPQTVFVLPESGASKEGVDSPQNDNHYSVHWEKTVVDQVRTTDDALAAADVTKVGHQTVSFHSGGGKVVERLMELDRSGNRLRADRLELHDCFYGNWQQSFANWARTDNGRQVSDVIYYHGSNDDWRQDVVAKAFKGKYTKVEMSRQGPVADHNPVARDSNRDYVANIDVRWVNGRQRIIMTEVRNYNPDPHYRTTGQFLGMEPGPLDAKGRMKTQ
jgi:hypothetical protein